MIRFETKIHWIFNFSFYGINEWPYIFLFSVRDKEVKPTRKYFYTELVCGYLSSSIWFSTAKLITFFFFFFLWWIKTRISKNITTILGLLVDPMKESVWGKLVLSITASLETDRATSLWYLLKWGSQICNLLKKYVWDLNTCKAT